jgi:hypothetical protein
MDDVKLSAARKIADRCIPRNSLAVADVKRLRVNDFEEKALAAFSDKLTDRKQRDAYRAIQALARMARGEE